MLDRFTEVGLIDDRSFAEAWVSSRQRSRGLAKRALASELRDKGVAGDVVADALDGIDPASEEAAARELVRRKLRSMRGLDPPVRHRRLMGALARKGHSAEVAQRAIRAELADAVDEADEPIGPF